MRKHLFKVILFVLALSGVAWAAGSWSTNQFSFKPQRTTQGTTDYAAFNTSQDRVDARLGKEVWVGDTNKSGYTTFAAAVATLNTAGTACILRLASGTHTVSSDLTCNSNINIRCEKGAILAIADTKTLTINGYLDAGLYQVISFTPGATPPLKFAATSPQVNFYPEWFGAAGDGVTDDLAALNACREAMIYYTPTRLAKGIMHLSRWYAISSTFSLAAMNYNTTTFTMRGTGKENSGLIATVACDNKPIMEIVGSPNIYLEHFGLTGVTRTLTSGYAGTQAPNVALFLSRSTLNPNAYNSRFYELGIWGYFRRGLVYNYGYSNAVFYGLQTYTSPLNNAEYVFNMCFSSTYSHPVRPFDDIVPTNGILSTRTDFAGEDIVLDHCYFAEFSTPNNGWKVAGNACIYQWQAMPYLNHCAFGGLFGYEVYSIGSGVNIRDSFGDGYGTIAGVFLGSDAYSTGWGTSTCVAEAQIRNYTNTLINSIALMTDSYTTLKSSIITNIRGNNGYKIQLGKGALDCRFENNQTMVSFISVGNFDNCYLDVPRLCGEVSITGGTTYHSKIKDDRYGNLRTYEYTTLPFQIGAPGGTTPDFLIGKRKIVWAAAAPTAGSWSEGSIIFRDPQATGQPIGWSCVLDNTFGTLTANTGSITHGSKILTVANLTNIGAATGLKVGDWIDVVDVTNSPRRVVNVNLTTKEVTLDTAVTTTGTTPVVGGAVTFHNHSTADAFKAWANLP